MGKPSRQKTEPTPKRLPFRGREQLPFPAGSKHRWRGWKERNHRPKEVAEKLMAAAEDKRERRRAKRLRESSR